MLTGPAHFTDHGDVTRAVTIDGHGMIVPTFIFGDSPHVFRTLKTPVAWRKSRPENLQILRKKRPYLGGAA